MNETPLDNLSVSIVCKDNASTIGRTLESVKGLVGAAGEIVAVDSGSTDGTIAMLEAAGARVVRSAWMGHVKTKQFALEQCAREWVLCLDSDEPAIARQPTTWQCGRSAGLRIWSRASA